MNTLITAVLCITVLLGAALLLAMRADRRRQNLQQRLQAVTAPTHSDAGQSAAALPSLRLPVGRRTMSGLLSGEMRAWLEAELATAGGRIGLLHLVAVGGLAAVAVFAFVDRLLALNPALGLLLAAVAAPAAAAVLLRLAQARYRNRFLDVFPDALDLIARAVKAGLPVAESMAVAAHEIAEPVGGELRRTLDEMQIGVEAHDALQRTADRIRIPDFRFYVVALTLQRRTGGSLAETLGNLSAVIRARKQMRLKARALAAETKASAFVLAVLPFVVGGFLFMMNRPLMSVLLTDPRGRYMFGLAFLSLASGIAVMAWIIKRSLR
jgi:tight adherence protein B